MKRHERRQFSSEMAHRIEGLFLADSCDGAPGLVYGVLWGGEPVVRGHRGLAVVEHGIALDQNVRLRIGSVSKHFACAMALLLEEEGRLSLDDVVARHLPVGAGGPVWGDMVSIRQLCQNTGGVADFLEGLHLSGAGVLQPTTSAQCAELTFRQPHLNCRPGARLVYSAGGFLVLSLLLERVTGQPMDEMLRRRLFAPAAMPDTALVGSDTAITPRMAAPYVRAPDGTLCRGGWGLELNCEGGIVSTLDDMHAWATWLLRDAIGTRLLRRLSEPTTYANGTRGVYGLGLACVSLHGRCVVGHGGRTPGFRTEMWLVPEQQAAVIVIANDNGIVTDDLAFAAVRLLCEDLPERPVPPPAVEIDWTQRSGHYADGDGVFCLGLGAGDDGPWLETSSARYRLVPLGGRRFRVASPLWDAVLDVPGTTDHLVLTDSGQPLAIRRCRPPVGDVTAGLAGSWFNESLGATYRIEAAGDAGHLRMQGRRGSQDYRLTAVSDETIIATPFGRFAGIHRPRLNLVRDGRGTVTEIRVSTERTAALPFHRLERKTLRA